MKPGSRRKVFWCAAVLLVIASAVFLFSARHAQQRIEWLSTAPRNTPPHFKFLGPLAWPANRWWLRAKQPFTSKPISIYVTAKIYEVRTNDSFLPQHDVVWRETNRNGDQAWLVKNFHNWTALRSNGKPVEPQRMSISFGENIPAQISMSERVPILQRGSTNVQMEDIGHWIDASAERDHGGVALTCFHVAKEQVMKRDTNNDEGPNYSSIRTNCSFGVRIHIPSNHALLLISGRTNSSGERLATQIVPSIGP